MSEIEKIISDIEDSILKAEASYQLWWGIEHHGRKEYLGQLNNHTYVDFFHASIPIYFQSIFINLSKIFDRASDLSGISSLKKELGNLGHNAAVLEIENELSAHKMVVESVKGIRHESAAHKKTKKNTNQIYSENPLTSDEIKEVISVVKTVIVIASKAIGRESNVLLSNRYCKAAIGLLEALK